MPGCGARTRIGASGDVTGHRDFVNVAAAQGAQAAENTSAAAGTAEGLKIAHQSYTADVSRLFCCAV